MQKNHRFNSLEKKNYYKSTKENLTYKNASLSLRNIVLLITVPSVMIALHNLNTQVVCKLNIRINVVIDNY